MIAAPGWSGSVEEGRRIGGEWTDPLAREQRCLLVGCGRGGQPLAGALSQRGFRSALVESLAEARRELRSWAPDLVVVGEGLQGSDAVSSLPHIAAEGSGSPLLFLADRWDRELAMRALEHGADDVVVPPHSVSAILLRYHLVGSRFGARRTDAPPVHPQPVRLGSLEVDLPGRRVLSGGRPQNLSGREFELLSRLMEARGKVVSREALLEDIWGSEQGSEAVLDATVHRLRRKLEEEAGEPRLLTTVRGVGYRLEVAELPR